jgi:competence protein ComEC
VLSLAKPLLSVFCVPVFAGVLYPSLLVACALKETGLTGAADAIADVCGKAATFCVSGLAALALRGHWIGCLGPWAMLAGAAIAAFTLRARPPLRFALLGALACLRAGATLLPQDAQAGHEPFARRVEQLDVGQGDAALVVTGTRGEPSFGLIDSGSARALGDRAWIELLARRGAARLEWIALTHLDEDHSGGVKRLGRLVQIGCVATSRGELESPRGQTYKQDLESLGIRLTDWSGGCVPFPTLAPPERSRPGARNQNMGAIFIPLGPRGAEGFYLSAGDAEARDEPRIGAWAAALAARSDIRVPPAERILKISHHGSKTSSNPVFIRELAPTRAWISVGVGNRYGHPSASVLRELDELRIPYTRTDEKGALCAGRCGWLAPWRDD